jgi:hypothetical protein
MKKHANKAMREIRVGEHWTAVTAIPDEGVVIVQTTPEGHRQIQSALDSLRE